MSGVSPCTADDGDDLGPYLHMIDRLPLPSVLSEDVRQACAIKLKGDVQASESEEIAELKHQLEESKADKESVYRTRAREAAGRHQHHHVKILKEMAPRFNPDPKLSLSNIVPKVEKVLLITEGVGKVEDLPAVIPQLDKQSVQQRIDKVNQAGGVAMWVVPLVEAFYLKDNELVYNVTKQVNDETQRMRKEGHEAVHENQPILDHHSEAANEFFLGAVDWGDSGSLKAKHEALMKDYEAKWPNNSPTAHQLPLAAKTPKKTQPIVQSVTQGEDDDDGDDTGFATPGVAASSDRVRGAPTSSVASSSVPAPLSIGGVYDSHGATNIVLNGLVEGSSSPLSKKKLVFPVANPLHAPPKEQQSTCSTAKTIALQADALKSPPSHQRSNAAGRGQLASANKPLPSTIVNNKSGHHDSKTGQGSDGATTHSSKTSPSSNGKPKKQSGRRHSKQGRGSDSGANAGSHNKAGHHDSKNGQGSDSATAPSSKSLSSSNGKPSKESCGRHSKNGRGSDSGATTPCRGCDKEPVKKRRQESSAKTGATTQCTSVKDHQGTSRASSQQASHSTRKQKGAVGGSKQHGGGKQKKSGGGTQSGSNKKRGHM